MVQHIKTSLKASLIILLFVPLHVVLAKATADDQTTNNPIEKTDLISFNKLSIGHLLSPNTNVLNTGEVSVGFLHISYGINHYWTLGTSPWVDLAYDMGNILSKWAWAISKTDRFAIDFQYFKTRNRRAVSKEFETTVCDFEKCVPDKEYRQGFDAFKMEAWNLKFTRSRQFSKKYRLNIAASYYHYIDDERPFSLRMDPANNDNYAINLTTLNEFKISSNYYISVEAGFWGLNYQYPYIHAGVSLNRQTESHILGFGFSQTSSPSFPKEKTREYVGYNSLSAVHPELQIQWVF